MQSGTNHVVVERYLGTVMTWHAVSAESGGAFSLGEVLLSPGDEPPMHIHAREDEMWYILEGSILFQRGMERLVRGAGESILLPRGVPHGFAVNSPSARILHFYSPAGIEGAFREVSVPLAGPVSPVAPAAIEAAFGAKGVTFTGPPLPVLLAAERSRERPGSAGAAH